MQIVSDQLLLWGPLFETANANAANSKHASASGILYRIATTNKELVPRVKNSSNSDVYCYIDIFTFENIQIKHHFDAY